MTSLPPEHRVDVVETGTSARRDRIRCAIDEHLRFDTRGIETYCVAGWNPTAYDACVVGAAVQFCDHTARRPSTAWRRAFALRVPVHDPGRWGSPDVSGALQNALQCLTSDRWRIDFVPRRKYFAPQLQNLDLPSSCVVMPFSDGLDSHMVAALLQREHGDSLVRVRLESKSSAGTRRRTAPSQAFASMPWRVSYGDTGSVEPSARSRGFTFALLSGIAAVLCKSRRITLPESGQGALGPPLVPVGQAHADLRSHPSFTGRMETFVSALFGHAVCYEYPRLWRTKGETLAEFLEACPEDVEWVATRSCWQGARHVSVSGSRRQCGICAACLLRRLSVHAAGRSEAPETYVWEDLSAARFEDGAARAFRNAKPRGALHEYAIAGVLHLDHLANLRQSAADASLLKKQIFLLSRSFGLDERETRDRLERMLRRHEEEWRSFVESLGRRSFVAQWIARGHGHGAYR